MTSLENVDISQYVVLLHHTNALQKSLGDYHASTPRNLNFRDRSAKIAILFCQRPLQITYWRTSNGYLYWRTFSGTELLHQKHNTLI